MFLNGVMIGMMRDITKFLLIIILRGLRLASQKSFEEVVGIVLRGYVVSHIAMSVNQKRNVVTMVLESYFSINKLWSRKKNISYLSAIPA